MNNGNRGIFSINCSGDGGASAPADQIGCLVEQYKNLIPLVPSPVLATARTRVFRPVSSRWKHEDGFIGYSRTFVDGYDDWIFAGLPDPQ